MTAPAAQVVKKVAKKRVTNSQTAAKAGQKSARKVAATKPQTPSGSAPRTASGSGAQSKPRQAVNKAASSTGKAARTKVRTEVRTVKQNQQKTKTAVASKYRSDKVLGLAEMRPKTRTLAAEYMAAIVMAVILLFVGSDKKTYHERVARFFIQITGISGIFFFMSLASSSSKAAKFTVPFGLLLDLSLLAFLMKEGGAAGISSAVGKKSDKDKTDYGEILHDFLTGEPSEIVSGIAINPPLKRTLHDPSPGLGVITTPGNSGVTPGPGGGH